MSLQETIGNLRRECDLLKQQVKEFTDIVARLEAGIQSLNIRGRATSHDWGAPVTKPPSAESI